MQDLDYFPHRVFVLGAKMCWLSPFAHGFLRPRLRLHRLCRSDHSVINTSWRRIGLGPSLEYPSALKTCLFHPPPKTLENPALTLAYRHSLLKRPRAIPRRTASLALLSQFLLVSDLCISLEAVPRSGMQPIQSMIHPVTTPIRSRPHRPPARATSRCHRRSQPARSSPVVTPVTGIMVTPASASTISPVSPIRARFGFPMTHALPTAAFGDGAVLARDPEMEIEEDIDDADVRTEIGSPEIGQEEELRLPPIRTLPPIPPYGESVVEQTRQAMRGGGAVLRAVLLYGPAGVTPAPAELARNNVCDKLPPVPSRVPPHQAIFFGVQSVPVADGSGRFATICTPPRRCACPHVDSTSLPHGGLTAPIERRDEVTEWEEQQRAKERVDIVVKDGELSQVEKLEMEKRVCVSGSRYVTYECIHAASRVRSNLAVLSFGARRRQIAGPAPHVCTCWALSPMSVKVINHIYYGADDVPKARSPTQTTRRLPEEHESNDDTVPSGSSDSRVTQSAGSMYFPPTPAPMPSSPGA
ncbi:hypothetical protein FS749_010663 [Ceratobasidium sp. UAMH 11750]|nr:hypothetical protein FS749_010663 [Ceratobasidium sp. UAMH 11750]